MKSFANYIVENSQENEFQTRTFRVPVEHMDDLKAKIAGLNKKAAKLRCAPSKINLLNIEHEDVRDRDNHKTGEVRSYQMLTVTGQIPVLAGGWSFVGKLEHDDTVGTIVRSAPGKEVPVQYRKMAEQGHDPYCEHCNIKRFRNKTFIVKNPAGEHKSVGGSCLKDFLGHPSPEQYAAYAEMIHSMEDDYSEFEDDSDMRGQRIDPSFKNTAVLAAAIHNIKAYGFQNAQSDSPTKNDLVGHFNSRRDEDRIKVTEQDEKDAEECEAWLKTVEGDSEFFMNLRQIAGAGVSKSKHWGYVAAGAAQWLKHKDMIKARAASADGISDEPIAPIGTKTKVTGEVISAFQYQGQSFSYYDSGVRTVLTIKTVDNKLVKMFTANSFATGDKVTISGKIGKHEMESYDKSQFKGKMITSFAPRARIEAAGDESVEHGKGMIGKEVSRLNGQDRDGLKVSAVVTAYSRKKYTVSFKNEDGDTWEQQYHQDSVEF